MIIIIEISNEISVKNLYNEVTQIEMLEIIIDDFALKCIR